MLVLFGVECSLNLVGFVNFLSGEPDRCQDWGVLVIHYNHHLLQNNLLYIFGSPDVNIYNHASLNDGNSLVMCH